MADSTPTVLSKVVQPNKFSVVSQKGNVLWVEGSLASYQHPGFHHALLSVAPGDNGIPVQFQNRYFPIERVGAPEQVSTSTTITTSSLSSPVIQDPGSGYRTGAVVQASSPSGSATYVVTSVDSNGGVTGINLLTGPEPTVAGTYTLATPSPSKTKGDPSTPVKSATFSLSVVTNNSTQYSSVVATPIHLAEMQGPAMTATEAGQGGSVLHPFKLVKDLDFSGLSVHLDGVAVLPVRI